MPKGGYKQTEEHRQKLGKARIGHIVSDEARKKIGRANSINLKGHKISDETRAKLSKAAEGHITSEETRRKIGKANSIKLKGKHLTMEHKQKISRALKGGKSHFWQGGISYEPYSTDWTDDLREAIRKRDNYTCQLCGIHQDELEGRNRKLDVHHKDYDKDNLAPDNLVTLCRECHAKTNFNREYWTKYFKEIIENKGRW